MDIEYRRAWSRNLGQDMELKVYGRAGKPVMVFPCQAGRFYEYEDFGMVEACRPFIDAGAVTLFTVDSVDRQSWLDDSISVAARARRHNAYDRYVVEEVAPFVREYLPDASGILATGCSMGAYHAANFFFRHPDVFDAVIALSGLYSLNLFIGDYMDDDVYFHVPLAYLANLTDPWYIDRYRRSRIVVCVGQGRWEDEMLADTRALHSILAAKEIPAWVDYWGRDVDHDWPWWRRQMPYFLGRLRL
jgi:esterase/lipase superfamily enzyme